MISDNYTAWFEMVSSYKVKLAKRDVIFPCVSKVNELTVFVVFVEQSLLPGQTTPSMIAGVRGQGMAATWRTTRNVSQPLTLGNYLWQPRQNIILNLSYTNNNINLLIAR